MNLNSEIIVAAQLSADGKRFKRSGLQHVPYSSSAEVLATIPGTRRHVGQLFTISNGGSIEDWHFVGGIADGNLVKKDTGGGSSLVYRGAWDVATTYVKDDVVNYNGSSFLALAPSTGVVPVGGSTWGILAEKGNAGAQGIQGIQGIQGEPGTPASDMLNAPLYFEDNLIKIPPADEDTDGYLPATLVQQILEDFAKWVLAADSLYTFKKVGLGIETPTEKLDIDGNIKFREYLANQKYGKILHFGNYPFWDTVPANPDEFYAGRGAGGAGPITKYNVGIGAYALGSLTGLNDANNSGWYNTAIGKAAGFAIALGKWNVAVGANCVGSSGNNNVYVAPNPGGAADSGNNNIVIGYGQRAPVAANSDQLNIGGWIYGAGGKIGLGVTNPTEKLEVAGSIKQSGVVNAPTVAADANGKFVAGEALPYNLLITTSSTPAGILASKAAFETATGKQTYRYDIIGNNIYIGIKGAPYELSGNLFQSNSQIGSIKDFGLLVGISGTGMFKNSSLNSVDLPGLKYVGYNCFENCTFNMFMCPLLDASTYATDNSFLGVATAAANVKTLVMLGAPFTGISGVHAKATTYT